jgi:DHA2 family methylenomycin A resistance protein-like MFS transporter
MPTFFSDAYLHFNNEIISIFCITKYAYHSVFFIPFHRQTGRTTMTGTTTSCLTATCETPLRPEAKAAPQKKPQTHYDRWPLVAVALGFVMAMLDVTVVNVGLTRIQADLGITLAGLVWVVDGYTLTFAALLLIGGALASRHGARAVYMAGLVLFVSASALCALAPTGAALIAARLVQGAGAALFMPASLSLMTQSYPDDRIRVQVLAIWSAIVSVAAVLGPVVGGTVIAALGWRAIFWLNVPIGIIGVMLTRRHIAVSPRQRLGLNPSGHALAVTGLAALAFAMIENGTYGWFSLPIIGALLLGIAAIAAFAARERHSASPILPQALRRNTRFTAANGIGFFVNLAAFGQLFLISLYLQQARGDDAWHTGLDLLPLLMMFTLGNLASGRISIRWGTRLPLVVGLASAALLTAGVTATAGLLPYWLFAALIMLINLGVGVAIPAMTVTVMEVAGQDHANIAAAALNANRQIGALIGVALIGAILHRMPAWHGALPLTFGLVTTGYLAAAALALRYLDGAEPAAATTLRGAPR